MKQINDSLHFIAYSLISNDDKKKLLILNGSFYLKDALLTGNIQC